MAAVITLTTDFGWADPFVGQMKGAVLELCPEARLVDLTHEAPAHDPAAAAWLVETGTASFPAGTIHVAVVDPGVGTDRRGIVAVTDAGVYVAPDNGILGRVLERESLRAAHVLAEPRYRRASVSPTFHGRDVFAPAAAHLARGVPPADMGPPAGALCPPAPRPRRGLVPGEPLDVPVVWVDRFGNAVLDLAGPRLHQVLAQGGALRADTPGGPVVGLLRTYGEGSAHAPCLVIGSTGYLEIAWPRGRAADRLGLSPGVVVRVTGGAR
jgi:S-adenosylmethionine hydrolase